VGQQVFSYRREWRQGDELLRSEEKTRRKGERTGELPKKTER
jgi:hypothetical protein